MRMNPKPQLARDTLAEQVYSALKARILSGELKQGERIAEMAISEEFGVSATPVREALRLLNGDSLIRFEGRRGARVIRPTVEEVVHSYEVRRVLETTALREAIADFSEEEQKQFVELAEKTLDFVGDPMGFLDGDREFHEFFIKRTGNKWILKFYTEISNFLLIVRLSKMTDWKIENAAKEHIEIARAASRRDADAAIEILVQQIETSKEWAVNACREYNSSNPT